MTDRRAGNLLYLVVRVRLARRRRLHLFRASSLPSRFLLNRRRRKRSHGLGFRLPFPYLASEMRPSVVNRKQHRKRASFGSE